MAKYNYIRLYFTVNGKHYEVTGKTQEEAEEKKRAKMRSLEIGLPDDIKVCDWSRIWLDTYVIPRVRPAGREKMRGTMTEHSATMYNRCVEIINMSIGSSPMQSVRNVQLQKIINEHASSKSLATKLRSVIRALFSQAFDSRVIQHDPTLKLTIPAVPKSARRSLTDYEREILLKVAKTHRCGLWIRVLLRTGMRPAESLALRVKHVDIENAVIHIRESLECGSDLPVPPKTDAGVRDIPILSDIKQDLKDLIAGRDPDDFVFLRDDGTRATSATRHNWWISFRRAMDLEMGAEHTTRGHIFDPSDLMEDGTPIFPDPQDPTKPRNGHRIADDLVLYCLRHTFCTDMKKAGVPLATAKVVMGHDDITTTANIYMDTFTGEYKIVANLMNA